MYAHMPVTVVFPGEPFRGVLAVLGSTQETPLLRMNLTMTFQVLPVNERFGAGFTLVWTFSMLVFIVTAVQTDQSLNTSGARCDPIE